MSEPKSVIPFEGELPRLAENVFIADTARVIGDVEIGEQSSLWYGVVARGDVEKIRIGQRTNIQDGTVVHVSSEGLGTFIGSDVTVGHMALLHACTVGDGAFVGMMAGVMDGAVIEPGAMVAAGALVTPGKRVLSGQLWSGRPAKYWRDLTDSDLAEMRQSAARYVELAGKYL
ncbi:MAG: gamma carbonic anhydrase family protein [Pseudomonadota bacterium]